MVLFLGLVRRTQIIIEPKFRIFYRQKWRQIEGRSQVQLEHHQYMSGTGFY